MQATKNEMNFPLKTDSYKLGHWRMYLPGTQYVESYAEARKGAKYDKTMFFGLQYILKKHFTGIRVTHEMIDDTIKFAKRHFGKDGVVNEEMWRYIVDAHGGKLPIEIKAVKEGSLVPVSNVLFKIVNTDPKCAALTSHCETILTHYWYSSNVATISYEAKKMFKKYLNITHQDGDKFAGLDFMLHDFGYRGVSCYEQASVGGAGHLVNFLGSDTIAAMLMIEDYYDYSTGYSVDASEHSIMTSLGRKEELKIVKHLLDEIPDGIISIVCDSFDDLNFTDKIIGQQLKDQVIKRNGKVVIRPDSGEPTEVMLYLFESLWAQFGGTVNKKGYRQLNPQVGLIWGDGIDLDGIDRILKCFVDNKICVSNAVFGMGGSLLQKHNRDTQRSAFKCSAQMRDGTWYDIVKDPKDATKKSKSGRLELIKDHNGEYQTILESELGDRESQLVTVFRNGDLIVDYNFKDIVDLASTLA